MNRSDGSFAIVDGKPDGNLESKWRACLAASDFPTHYTAPEYFLEPSLRRKRPFAILSLAGEEVTGVLTGVHQGDRVQSGLSVRPQIALSRNADGPRTLQILLAGLVEKARSATLVDVFVWSDMAEWVDAHFLKRPHEGAVVMDLDRDSEAMFRRLSSKRRADIKKAIKSGISVDAAVSRDDVSEFYVVHCEWARRKGQPIVEEEEFTETFALTANRRLLLARHEDRVIAGVVHRYFPGGVMEYAANNSLESALPLRPNDLLQWRAIEWGCAEGLTKYSLGGTHFFLRKFGGKVLPTTRCRLDLSVLRRYAISDWLRDQLQRAHPFVPNHVIVIAKSVRRMLNTPRVPRP
jgi:hypothetical protein